MNKKNIIYILSIMLGILNLILDFNINSYIKILNNYCYQFILCHYLLHNCSYFNFNNGMYKISYLLQKR